MRELKGVVEFTSSVDDVLVDSVTKWFEEEKPNLPLVVAEKIFDGTSHKYRVCHVPRRKTALLAITNGDYKRPLAIADGAATEEKRNGGKVVALPGKFATAAARKCRIRHNQMTVKTMVAEISYTWLLPGSTTPFVLEMTLPPAGLPGNGGGGAKGVMEFFQR